MCLNEVYKSSVGHFLTIYIFYVLILNIENKKFHFLTKMSEIYKKALKQEIVCSKTVYEFFFFLRYLVGDKFFSIKSIIRKL